MAKIITALLLSLTTTLLASASDVSRESQEDSIREAVFRWQFDHNASGQRQKAHVYYLALGEKMTDPSEAFINRFSDNNPPVAKASASRIDTSKGIVDKVTGERGLRFWTADIKWISDTEVQVRGGYYEGNESSSRNTYTVKKEGGIWKVTQDKMNRIS